MYAFSIVIKLILLMAASPDLREALGDSFCESIDSTMHISGELLDSPDGPATQAEPPDIEPLSLPPSAQARRPESEMSQCEQESMSIMVNEMGSNPNVRPIHKLIKDMCDWFLRASDFTQRQFAVKLVSMLEHVEQDLLVTIQHALRVPTYSKV